LKPHITKVRGRMQVSYYEIYNSEIMAKIDKKKVTKKNKRKKHKK
jgi:hypothetical protein